MSGKYEAVIGLEVHAELQTRSKMFCSCPVVDLTTTRPNQAVCPVCSGQPGVLPVVNRQAVAFGIKVALALNCAIPETSLFDRKNYFYPDLPKGYQISQYEHPLADHGELAILVDGKEKMIRIRRVHLEEDTGKLTHVEEGSQQYSLVDLNRAGVPLLEIVSEPDMRSPAEALAYGKALRDILRYLGVNSGELEKGVIRFEANVSVRPLHSQTLGTRTEVKNLNSFKAMEKSLAYEIKRQSALLESGESYPPANPGLGRMLEALPLPSGKRKMRMITAISLSPISPRWLWIGNGWSGFAPRFRNCRRKNSRGLPLTTGSPFRMPKA